MGRAGQAGPSSPPPAGLIEFLDDLVKLLDDVLPKG
jgi:hypothetical protein